ncbi:conserved hypothetical protein [Ricinus communis]|uniref:Uncharacterized protein n=1 Tax=Ricinus communis TaxID=3988 RepID=B9TJT6_RICCO|nr:conserved hypothetical protein [Ricinus communis]
MAYSCCASCCTICSSSPRPSRSRLTSGPSTDRRNSAFGSTSFIDVPCKNEGTRMKPPMRELGQ